MAPEKRRASARLRAEPPSKKQAVNRIPLYDKPPPNPPAKPVIPIKNLPDPEVVLPNKVEDGVPLPTLPNDFVSTKPESFYKSIADSGVLTASLQRSRQRWAQGYMFEKYWSKSTYKKKKDQLAAEANQQASKDPRPQMTKVGSCKLVAEPHFFDITLYVVRDTPQPLTPASQPFIQYGPTTQHIAPSPGQPYTPPVQPQNHKVTPTPIPTPPVRAPAPPQAPKPATTTDPVIQMLAQRASTDNALKQVMKIVASGKADPAQLEYFQKHIDELTQIVKQRQEDERRAAAAAAAPRPHGGTVDVHGRPINPPVSQPSPIPRPAYSTTPLVAAPSPGPQQSYNASQPHPIKIQQMRPQQTPMKPRPQGPPPLHVLIEFSINTTDRFLFPKNAILEHLPGPGAALLVSFLVVKKPSQLAEMDGQESKKPKKKEEVPVLLSLPEPVKKSAKEKAREKEKEEEKEVYQPVTIRLERPSDPSVFGVLSRVVAPVEEVQKYMLEVAQRCAKAEDVKLALRLPKEKSDVVHFMKG